MAKLTDYLDAESLGRLGEAFSEAAGTPIWIALPCGECIGPAVPDSRDARRVEVTFEAEMLGYVVSDFAAATDAESSGRLERLQRLMVEMLARLCDRQKELHTRVDDLVTLFRVTAEFAAQRDLTSLLDLIARTVVEAMKAKACSIRLLSEDHSELLIQAVAGLSPEYLDKGPILLKDSKIDAEVLSGPKTVYIRDERTDPRVLYPAEARAEGIVSALCAPLVYKGHPEGVVHVYTGQPHEFDWFEISLLESIAAEAAAAIVNARLHREAVDSADMRRQVRLAAQVQKQMIPSEPPKIAGLDIGAIYVPCFELGGDFYDFIDLPPDNVGVALCDVAGKGVRASLMMASVRASLRAHAENIYEMSDVLARVNRDLCAGTLTGDFATLFYGVLDVRTRLFTYANAGHTPPVVFSSDGARHLTTGGPILGIDPDFQWRQDAFVLRPGDVMLGFTDGLPEAMNFEDESFGYPRTERAALAAIEKGRSAAGIVNDTLWEMRRFAGLQTRLDDLTLIAIKVL